ncbi:MAG: serine/threonine-protein kinase, partial [Planctomycetota bacterium]
MTRSRIQRVSVSWPPHLGLVSPGPRRATVAQIIPGSTESVDISFLPNGPGRYPLRLEVSGVADGSLFREKHELWVDVRAPDLPQTGEDDAGNGRGPETGSAREVRRTPRASAEPGPRRGPRIHRDSTPAEDLSLWQTDVADDKSDRGSALEPGTVLQGRYLIRDLLGAGGMGEVYRAEHTELRVDLALKVIRPALSCSAAFLERFRREGRLLARLKHPRIVHVFDMWIETGGRAFIAMELVCGPSGDPLPLAEHMARRGRMEEPQIVATALDVCEALTVAHLAGVLHRDIKPANILLDGDMRAKVTDFGLAKLTARGDDDGGLSTASTAKDALMTRPGKALGTPQYMSPEQKRGEELDVRSDIYSCGVVVYE